MLTRLQYQAGSTLRNLYLAIKAVVTGTTDKTTLPSDIVQASSYIRTTAAVAGWEAFDLNVYDQLPVVAATGIGGTPTRKEYIFYAFGLWAYVLAAASTTQVYTSPNKANWTLRLTVATSYSIACAYNGTAIVLLAANSIGYSTVDGISWTATTGNGAVASVCAVGTTFVAIAGGGTTAWVSVDNGATFTTETIPSGAYSGVASNGTTCCAVGTNVCATRSSGGVWSAQTITAGAWIEIASSGTNYCAMSTNICTTSPTGATGTWAAQSFTGTAGHIEYDSVNGLYVTLSSATQIAFSSDGSSWAYRTLGVSVDSYSKTLGVYNGSVVSINLSGLQFHEFKYNYLSCGLKALCDDGVSYKYAILDMGLGNSINIQLRCYQSITGYTYANIAYQSDNNAYNQRLDLTNGGYILVWASKYYLGMDSYMSGDIWGSLAGNTPTGIYEYTRDDPVNEPPYSTWGHQISTSFGLQCPILRMSTTADTTGVSALLLEAGDFPLKKIIAANGISEEHPVRSVRVGTSTANNTIMGGALLGGIYRTTDSFGATGDLMDVTGTDSHMVIKMGAAVNRYLIPNG